MKANTSALMRKGYTTGVLSGMTWGLDTVLIGVAMAMSIRGESSTPHRRNFCL